jgi:ParB family chromosome partitioning protein
MDCIQPGRGGRGRLVISYHSLEELDGILERIR